MEDVRVPPTRRSTAGRQYPADPPRVDEIIAVMRAAGEGPFALRLRALIVILWRSGLRISEALALAETDLEPTRGSLLVRRGKGGKRREVGMDDWAWTQLAGWLEVRGELPVGPLLCTISRPAADGPGAGARSVRASGESPQEPASGGDSLHTSSATLTPSRWPARLCRST